MPPTQPNPMPITPDALAKMPPEWWSRIKSAGEHATEPWGRGVEAASAYLAELLSQVPVASDPEPALTKEEIEGMPWGSVLPYQCGHEEEVKALRAERARLRELAGEVAKLQEKSRVHNSTRNYKARQETVEALRPVLAQRPDDVLLFRTRNGNPWVYDKAKMKGTRAVNAISNDNFKQRWNDLTKPIGLKIKGQGMYKLKHLHATVADTFPDKHAKDMLIGHALDKVKGHYVDVGVDRIRKLTDHIRKHLILSPVKGRRVKSGS